ncbi:MAG: hypothetical protein JKY62_09960 [Desulfocapsa sp.]|nr:hypothetical protein [Desulfocapsa sp.]
MAGKLSRLKPNASRSIHLFVAALLWTAVGLMMMSRGIVWLNAIDQLWIALPALLIGFVKSLFMLDKSAQKSIERIISTRDGKCLWGVYSVKTWLLILVMMITGFFIRNSSLPQEFLGLFYISIGWGLFFSSRKAWITWIQTDENAPEQGKKS